MFPRIGNLSLQRPFYALDGETNRETLMVGKYFMGFVTSAKLFYEEQASSSETKTVFVIIVMISSNLLQSPHSHDLFSSASACFKI